MAKSNNRIVIFVKLAVAGLLVWWLVQSDRLDLSSAAILFQKPLVLVVCLSAWLFSAVICNSLRWRQLVNAIGIDMGPLRAIQISLIGLFFNTFLPGSVGGDIVKAIYLYKSHPGGSRTPAMLTIILDRILGLCALFFLTVPVILWKWEYVASNQVLLSLSVVTVCISIAMGIFIFGVLAPWIGDKDPLVRLLRMNIVGFRFLYKIYEAVRFYKHQPQVIFKTLAISALSQSYLIFAVGFVALHLVGRENLDIAQFITIMPLGILATAIPIAPGGIGVGHVAFGTLFSFLGSDQGANIYNIYFLTVALPNMLGLFPYLLLRDTKLAAKVGSLQHQ